MVLGDDGFCLLQCRQPPLNLQIFVAGDAFDDATFLDEQLELAGLFGVAIAIQIGREVDAPGRDPVPFHDALIRCFLPAPPALPAIRARYVCKGVSHFILLSPRHARNGFECAWSFPSLLTAEQAYGFLGLATFSTAWNFIFGVVANRQYWDTQRDRS